MANTMEMVCKTLGIDRVNMGGKMILIEEQHGTNANFLVHSVLSHALKKAEAVCLILCHNTIGHYHNIGVRFGYNLLSLKDKGQVTVVDLMKIIINDIANMCIVSVNEKEIIPDVVPTKHADIAHKLFMHVKEKYEEASKFNSSVVLIIEDLNHLLDLGLGVRDTMYFMRYLRSFLTLYPTSQLCILMHAYQEASQHSDTDMIVNALKYMAHLCITTEPLKTGHSSNASGKLIVQWRVDTIRSMFNWMERTTHLFKLLDWQVKIFMPGTVSILS
ncbi:hypothetical protein HN011_008175 [Eciton burchellii]|nr:hypothetical protein HN011_008175 [Eciton burchellii]